MKKRSNPFYLQRKKEMKKVFLVFKHFFILMFAINTSMYANNFGQNQLISMKVENVTFEEFVESISEQVRLGFIYDYNKTKSITITLDVKNMPLSEVLNRAMKDTGFTAIIQSNSIIIKENVKPSQERNITIKGRVLDKDNNPIPGVTILIKNSTIGFISDVDGRFSITLPKNENIILTFSFVGMENIEVIYKGEEELTVRMFEKEEELEAVVVTGMYSRKKESFTGSSATYSAQELKMVSSQNILQSLKTLDPSFVIIENNEYGSDPNRMPDIEIRGKSSVVGLKEQYDTDPNQPLFILDGFETDLKTILDLNMDRVASVTILKDAASTALYGSKAANGVVVIETKQPVPGKFRVNYNGNFSLSIPDLSDYNLMNAKEKLEFEFKAGWFTAEKRQGATNQLILDSLYNVYKAAIARGVNTYWLSEPLRTALVQKHNIYAEGGDQTVRYGLGVSYQITDGVMKKSGNDLIGMNFDLIYRKGNFRMYNKMSIDYYKEKNPTVSFSNYSRANPYFEKRKVGNAERYLEVYYTPNKTRYIVENPLYNESLNSFDKKNRLNFTENLNMEWQPIRPIMVRGRFGIGKSITETQRFLSPDHTQFDNYVRERKGSYSYTINKEWFYDGDFTITYGQILNDIHQLNAVAGSRFRSTEVIIDGYTAVGFPSGKFDRPSFATGFSEGSKPNYSEYTTRSASFYLNAGYSYKNRYLLDANIRMDGTSIFGTNKRFTETWAVGLAWNVYHEPFMRNISWMDIFKIRASVGNPGNQNFNAFQSYTTYSFNTWLQNSFGTGMLIDGIGNPDLKWQKTIDKNIGLDLTLWNNRIHLTFDYYKKDTDPLLANINVSSSIGVKTVVTNMGKQIHKGINGTLKVSPIYIPEQRINWTLSVNFRHQKAEYRNIGNSLEQFNQENKNTRLERYYDGGSPTSLWAVRSLGINPANGREVFLKKDGTYTYIYDTRDEVKVGDSEPTLQGVIGSVLYYKGFSFSFYLRYSLGGDVFNKALWSKVENISVNNVRQNQDKRALYDRWEKPGEHARFKGISLTETTNISSRFVKTENYLKGESFSVGYDFPSEWIKALRVNSLRLQANMNDLFRISSVKEERGIEYPFARMVSASISLTF